MIFVDSSAWFAVYSPRDINHVSAVQMLRGLSEQLVTSDFVVDETLTLLRARGENLHALAFGTRMIESNSAQIEFVSAADFVAAWSVFRLYQDKEWSFTDCTSFVLMKRLGIQRAFAFDDHFRQFGTVSVVP